MKSLLLIPIALLLSCNSQKNSSAAKIKAKMDTWLGSSKQNLIMKNGLPLKTGPDGAGGEVLMYGDQVYLQPTASSRGKTIWTYRMFFINPQDRVYHWLVQRSVSPPQQIDLNVFIR